MSKLLFSLSLLCLINFYSHAQYLAYGRSIVDVLSAPNFHGRGYVKSGEKKAAKFIRKEFGKLKVQPLQDTDYFQKLKMDVNTFPSKCNLVIDQQSLIPGKDFIIDPASPSIKGEFQVLNFDSVESKAFKLATMMPSLSLKSPPSPFFLHIDKKASKDYKDILLKAKGGDFNNLVGIILSGFDKLTWSTATYQTRLPIFFMHEQALDQKALKHLSVNLRSKFIQNYQTQNVIAEIKGLNTDSVIVVSAHYDHLGRMGKETLFPGANDNASGIALMLALAKYFSNYKPKYSLVFMAFSGEEAGLIGSRFYVDNPLFALDRIKFVLNLDMAGTGDDGIQVVNSTIFKNEFKVLEKINTQGNYVPEVKTRGKACNSDHCAFHKRGVKSFFIYTLGGIQAYHDIYDKPETLPLTAFKGCFELYRNFLEQL